jgi:hypothetical protein
LKDIGMARIKETGDLIEIYGDGERRRLGDLSRDGGLKIGN